LRREAGSFLKDTARIHYGEFRTKVGKWVRAGHVQTAKHWMHGQPVEKNILAL
jgi:hypothetical protein